MLKLKDSNRDVVAENNQLKLVNEKLVDRLEELHAIIDKEAAAHTYFHNYPPK